MSDGFGNDTTANSDDRPTPAITQTGEFLPDGSGSVSASLSFSGGTKTGPGWSANYTLSVPVGNYYTISVAADDTATVEGCNISASSHWDASQKKIISGCAESDYQALPEDTSATEAGTINVYTTNSVNQYSAIMSGDEAFSPTYDFDGNATLIKTSTGTWSVSWNAENRPIRLENVATETVVTLTYDALGRCAEREVSSAGTVVSRECFVYNDFLQIAAFDVAEDAAGTRSFSLKRTVFWDPTEPIATRPLAVNIAGDQVYFPTVDLTKNVCELVKIDGSVAAFYDYTPFGLPTETNTAGTNSDGTTSAGTSNLPANPFKFSSEVYDSDLGLVYYNYRHYSPTLGRFLSRDPIEELGGLNLYAFVMNSPNNFHDTTGLWTRRLNNQCAKMLSIAKEDTQVKEISENIIENGCSLPDIICECCGGDHRLSNGYYTPPHGLFGLQGNRITICSNNLKKDEGARLKRTIAHEMLHVLQFCKDGKSQSCRDSICREIAAHYQATYRHLHGGVGLKERIKKGVILAVRNFCKNILKEEQDALFHEQYEECKDRR